MKRLEKLIVFICLAVLIIASILLYQAFYGYNAGRQDYITICRLAGMEEGGNQETDRQKTLTMENLMIAENPDYRAWIQIDGTSINYPVVKEREDGYYLTHTFRGLKNPCGAIFVDANCSFLAGGNTIIYGHNMRDRSMFGQLKSYLKEDFYEGHEWVRITSDGSEYLFRIFSCVVTEEEDSENYVYSFDSMEEKINFIEDMKRKSVVATAYRPDGTETLVTLSTCHGSDGRLLIMAAMPREGGENAREKQLS